MKKATLVLLFFYSIMNVSYGQFFLYNTVPNSSLNYQQINISQHQFSFNTEIRNYYNSLPITNTVSFTGNEMKIVVLYNLLDLALSNQDPFSEIYTTNVNYNQQLPSNITTIKMVVNVLMENADVPPFSPSTFENVYTKIIDLNALEIKNNYKKQFTISKNPTSDFVTINLEKFNSKTNITLQNTMGQVVSKKTFTNMEIINYPIEGENGVYFLSIENENGEKLTHKIIKK